MELQIALILLALYNISLWKLVNERYYSEADINPNLATCPDPNH